MANLKQVRSVVRALLPHADMMLVDCLVTKAGEELDGTRRSKAAKRRNLNAEIERIIKREEMIELGLK